MKQCSCCKEYKTLDSFYKDKRAKDGLVSSCKICHNTRTRNWQKNNVERCKEYAAQYQRDNKEATNAKSKRWKDKNKEHLKEYAKLNKERRREAEVARYKSNPAKHIAKTRARQTTKIQRTPQWLTEHDYKVIESKYAIAAWLSAVVGVKYHVDHIIPLRGKNVSGLHVPDNLSVIPAKENQSKGNRYGC
jgi:hypothetical protein